MKKRTFGAGKTGGARSGGRFGKSRTFSKKFVKASPSASWKLTSPDAATPRKNTISESFHKKTTAAKLVASLHDKKDRAARKLFLVEGEKSFLEAVNSAYQVHTIFTTNVFLETYPEIRERFPKMIQIVDENELNTLGTLAKNNTIIGVFHQKSLQELVITNEIVLAVTELNDPGNLGTLIRIADWYGISKIIASIGTVDVYNPKTISATKGSFARVDVYYKDLENFFATHKGIPIFAADMTGENIHMTNFPQSGILLLGSESHGISPDLKRFITKRVTIPAYGHAESLNVAIAAGIILDRWKGNLN